MALDNLVSYLPEHSSAQTSSEDLDWSSRLDREDAASDALFAKHLQPHQPLDQSLNNVDPLKTNRLMLEVDQIALGVYDGFAQRLDAFAAPQTRAAAIIGEGASFTGAALLSLALTRLANTAPQLAKTIGKGFKYAFLADLACQGGAAAYAGYKTWLHPEDYQENSKLVANTLGSGLFDLATIGTASAAGYIAGEITFGLKTLPQTLDAFTYTAEVPKLEYDYFQGRPRPAAEPAGTEMAALYHKQLPTVVRVNNGSGVIIDGEQGLIATNAHVGAGRSYHYATTAFGERFILRPIARDSQADLLIYKPLTPPSKPLPFAELAPDQKFEPGTRLFAIAHPGMPSKAYISEATVRSQYLSTLAKPGSGNSTAILALQAAGLIGDSGGPIFDSAGRLAAQIARGNAYGNRLFGPSSAHLREMLRLVKEQVPRSGWLEIKSKATLATDEAGVTKLQLSSTAEVRSANSYVRETAIATNPYASFGSQLGIWRMPGTASAFSLVKRSGQYVQEEMQQPQDPESKP